MSPRKESVRHIVAEPTACAARVEARPANMHTPGPWKLWTSNSWRRFHGENGPVCEPIVQNDGHPDLHFRNGGQDGPDARLIAAAPELLEALQAMLDRYGYDGAAEDQRIERAARAVIAKATGQ